MKRVIMAMTAACALSAGPAAAEVIELTAEVHAGGSGGRGVSGDRKDEAFHDGTTGGAYGLLVGAEVLWIDAWLEHNQFTDGSLLGTWTQFMVGADLDFEMGDKSKGEGDAKWAPGYGELGFGFGFGFGTGQQVDPPLDAAQVTDKGAVFQLGIGFGYKFNKVLSVGLQVPLQVSYLIKSGDGATADDLDNHYLSMQAAALLNLRLSFNLE